MSSPRLILASASPRRAELMRDAGFAFEVDPADIDEDDVPADWPPGKVALGLAIRKAAHVAARRPGCVVLGADTVVDCADKRLGKAEAADAARTMIRFQAGRSQRVLTGVAICASEQVLAAEVVTSEVAMRTMTDAEIDAYVATGNWRGKAGAYGIQDARTDPLVTLISGSFSNVVGLPIERVVEMLASVGVSPEGGT